MKSCTVTHSPSNVVLGAKVGTNTVSMVEVKTGDDISNEVVDIVKNVGTGNYIGALIIGFLLVKKFVVFGKKK